MERKERGDGEPGEGALHNEGKIVFQTHDPLNSGMAKRSDKSGRDSVAISFEK